MAGNVKKERETGEKNSKHRGTTGTSIVVIFVMHQSIETPTLWVPGKGGGFDIDPSQKASISLPPEAIV